MSHEAREERAFEALIADAFHKVNAEEVCGHSSREPNADEREILELLDNDFIERVLSHKPANNDEPDGGSEELAMAGDAASASLFRCEGVDDAVKAELEKADQEIIERKKRERNGETS
jgi:hypothetical protein